mmetsp:Transcript_90690/g.290697  ORF Transcript_90690/g.290697 Transcript_90690/m.290697 type:complete len:112 (+) Transcript_90690:746-1081(+)
MPPPLLPRHPRRLLSWSSMPAPSAADAPPAAGPRRPGASGPGLVEGWGQGQDPGLGLPCGVAGPMPMWIGIPCGVFAAAGMDVRWGESREQCARESELKLLAVASRPLAQR